MTPSGPPEEPAGNERIDWETAELRTCMASNRSDEVGQQTLRRSDAAGGCFDFSVARVSAACLAD